VGGKNISPGGGTMGSTKKTWTGKGVILDSTGLGSGGGRGGGAEKSEPSGAALGLLFYG